MTLREKLRVLAHYAFIIAWLGCLIVPPLAVISAYNARDLYTLGMYLVITMLMYWLTGVVICMLKDWSLD